MQFTLMTIVIQGFRSRHNKSLTKIPERNVNIHKKDKIVATHLMMW